MLGKYAGALLAVLTPAFLLIMAGAALFVAQGLPLSFLGQAALAFLGINAPAYVFVGAFALALPEVLPVRVFQVLYTGYWFWGNFLTPTVLPTLNGTLLTPKGDFVAGALFHVNAFMYVEPYTLLSAVASLLVLTGCAAAALLYQVFLALMGVDISPLGNLAARQLAWLTPSLALMGLGSVAALAFAQGTGGALLAGGMWLLQLLLKDWFAASPWARYLFVFMAARYPDHPDFWANQLCLMGITVVLVIGSALLLKREERYL